MTAQRPGARTLEVTTTSEGAVRPAGRTPPRWKIAVITWLGLYPCVLGVSVLLAPLLESAPIALRVFVITGLVVPLMVYLVVPGLTRLLASWLRR